MEDEEDVLDFQVRRHNFSQALDDVDEEENEKNFEDNEDAD